MHGEELVVSFGAQELALRTGKLKTHHQRQRAAEAGSLARIVRIEERTSVLRRSPDDTDPLERVVVANADQMVIVAALADPEPKTRFIDRCLVAAYDAGLDPLLVLTKSDLAAPRKLRAFYRPLDIPMLTNQAATARADSSPAAQGA